VPPAAVVAVAAGVLTLGGGHVPAAAAASGKCTRTLGAGSGNLQRFVRRLHRGDVGCLRGTFHTSLSIHGGGFRLKSVPGARATIDGVVFVASSSHDVVLAHLRFRSNDTPTLRVNGRRITIRGSEVTNDHRGICVSIGGGFERWGIARGVALQWDRIHDCGRLPATNHDHGVYVEGAVGTVVSDSLIYDNADRGIQFFPNAQRSVVTNNVIDGNGEGVFFAGDSGLASSDNVASRNVISNSRVRYNVESWWPSGNPVGTGNVASSNCLWNGSQGNVGDQVGFTATGNSVTNPLFADRTAKNFSVPSGSACAADVPSGGTTGSAPQTPPSPAAPAAPANVKVPVLSGTARSGFRLDASAGTWSVTTPLTVAYSWQRCDRTGATCAPTGATTSSYTLGTDDVGSTLRVVVTATNAAGSASATSSVSGVVQSKSRKSALSLHRAKNAGLRRFLLRR